MTDPTESPNLCRICSSTPLRQHRMCKVPPGLVSTKKVGMKRRTLGAYIMPSYIRVLTEGLLTKGNNRVCSKLKITGHFSGFSLATIVGICSGPLAGSTCLPRAAYPLCLSRAINIITQFSKCQLTKTFCYTQNSR